VYVTANRQVQGGLTWENLAWAFKSTSSANYHPLTWISHELDCDWSGLRPAGHHLTSVLIHAVNVGLAFLMLVRLTGGLWPSFAAAAFFGLHPLRVESVAWVAERKDVLSTLFWILAVLAYTAFTHCPQRDRRKRNSFYVLSLGSFCAALMSKPMVVTLPCILLLLDYWPLDRLKQSPARVLVIEKLPFLLIAAAWSCITISVQKSAGALAVAVPLADRAANALVANCRYLGKIFVPVDLAVFYPPAGHWPGSIVLLAAVLLAAISVLAIVFRRTRPFLIVGWLWFLLGLLPVIGLIQAGEQSMADRYTYVPSLGILMIVTWGAASALKRIPSATVFFAIGFIAAAVLLAHLTRIQIGYWSSTETLFTHALNVTHGNFVAHINLGADLEKKGGLQQAAAHFNQALLDKPTSVEAHNDLGVVLQKQNQPEAAIAEFSTALKLNPHYAEAHYNLGVSLSDRSRLDEAATEFHRAIKDQPDYPEAHYNLASVLSRQGRAPEAIPEYLESLRLQPDSPDAHNNLAAALLSLGKLDQAIAHCQAAIRLKPDYARAHFNLGVALAQKGDLESAITQFRQTLTLKPDYHAAQSNLDLLLNAREKMGDRR
jgi:tetratricopeptide (TPR) repeat protein